MILVIVESPAKAKTIQAFLGDGFEVDSSYGHVRDLPKNEMGFDTVSLKASYEVLDTKKTIVARLRKKTKAAKKVLLATDMDREGEAIAWHLYQLLKPNNFARISFNEITPRALKQAIQNEQSININMVAAQEARRFIDRYVGYTVSPWLARNLNRRRVSAGRVQTVALRIIYEREKAIQSFVSEPYFVIIATLTNGSVRWEATLDPTDIAPKEQKISHLTDSFESQNICDFIISKPHLKVSSVEKKQVKQPPSPAFTTSTLQQAASTSLNFTPKVTMGLAQKLYENGFITYMRTDSNNLSEVAIEEIRSWLEKWAAIKQIQYSIIPPTPNHWKSSAGAQDAHEGIRPTNVSDLGKKIEGANSKETNDLQALYQLVWRRAVASQMADAIFNKTIIKLQSSIDPRRGLAYTFVAKGSELVMPGWKILITKNTDSDDHDEENQNLPSLREGEDCKVLGVVNDKRFTKPQQRFTQASLIKELERQGVGRPATYAATIETLLYREYATMNKKHLVPTDLGEVVFEKLKNKFSFVEINFTKDMEQELDYISSGKKSFRDFMHQQIQELNNNFDQYGGIVQFEKPASIPIKDCTECRKGKLYIREGRSGSFLGCSNYPACKHTENL